MAIQFCAVPLKLRKTCPGMEIRVAVCKNIKKGYSVVTLFYKINNDISIVKMKSTPTNRSIMIILMGTKPGYPREKSRTKAFIDASRLTSTLLKRDINLPWALLHLNSDSIRLTAAIGSYGQ